MDEHFSESRIFQAQSLSMQAGKFQKIIPGFRPAGVGWFGAEQTPLEDIGQDHRIPTI
jgi:hypothetical protein